MSAPAPTELSALARSTLKQLVGQLQFSPPSDADERRALLDDLAATPRALQQAQGLATFRRREAAALTHEQHPAATG